MEDNSTIGLYHYTKVDTLRRYILPEMRLRMNALANTNDPTEALWPLSGENNTPNLVNDELTKVKNLSFSMRKDVDTSRGYIEGYEIHPMWAHYAEQWGGVCLEINYSKFIERNQQIIDHYNIRKNPISYVNFYQRKGVPYLGPGSSIDQGVFVNDLLSDDGFINERFFKKHVSWEYEQEYRFVALNNVKDEIFLSIEGAVDRIILGPKFDNKYYSDLKSMVVESKCIKAAVVDERGQIETNFPYVPYE